jgi:hypothetical protein
MNTMLSVDNFKVFSMALKTLELVTRNYEYILTRDFRLPPQCKWDIRSSRMLRSVGW